MSTTTVSVTSTTRNAELAELRRIEAEDRAEARRAAKRAEEKRRREEALRCRIEGTHRTIDEQKKDSELLNPPFKADLRGAFQTQDNPDHNVVETAKQTIS